MYISIILVFMVVVMAAIFTIYSGFNAMVKGLGHQVKIEKYHHDHARKERNDYRQELYLMKGYKRFEYDFPPHCVRVDSVHEVSVIQTAPIIMTTDSMMWGIDPNHAVSVMKSQIAAEIAAVLMENNQIEILSRDEPKYYGKVFVGVIRVVNPEAKTRQYFTSSINVNPKFNQKRHESPF